MTKLLETLDAQKRAARSAALRGPRHRAHWQPFSPRRRQPPRRRKGAHSAAQAADRNAIAIDPSPLPPPHLPCPRPAPTTQHAHARTRLPPKPLTDVDRRLARDDFGRQRRQRGDVEGGQVLVTRGGEARLVSAC